MHSKHHKHLERYGVFAQPSPPPELPETLDLEPKQPPAPKPVSVEEAEVAIKLLVRFEDEGGNFESLDEYLSYAERKGKTSEADGGIGQE